MPPDTRRRAITRGHRRRQEPSKSSRISVVWTSANYWHNGFIYGSVRFGFDWARLIKNNRVYWVEAIAYNNPAYRLLITDRDRDHHKHLTPYDPKNDLGPLRKKFGAWYWNRKYTSEFMINRDITLEEAIFLDYVAHSKCRESRHCVEEKLSADRVAAQVMAFVIGNDIHCIDHLPGTQQAAHRLCNQRNRGN
jgi:hypothetical protein